MTKEKYLKEDKKIDRHITLFYIIKYLTGVKIKRYEDYISKRICTNIKNLRQ